MPRCPNVKAYGQNDMQVNNKLHHKVKAYGQINMLSQQQASSYRLVTQKRSWLIKKGRSPPVPLTCLIWEYQQVNQKKVQPITQAYDCQHLVIEISNNKVHSKENHILRSTSSSDQTFLGRAANCFTLHAKEGTKWHGKSCAATHVDSAIQFITANLALCSSICSLQT